MQIWHPEPCGKTQWSETERVSPTLCIETYNSHSWETIVFLPLDDYFPFTHYKLTEVKPGVKMFQNLAPQVVHAKPVLI